MAGKRTSAQVVFGNVLEKSQAGEVICPKCGHHFEPVNEDEAGDEDEKPEGGENTKTATHAKAMQERWAAQPGLRAAFGCARADDANSPAWKEGLSRYLKARRK